jgi:hypothetical protein
LLSLAVVALLTALLLWFLGLHTQAIFMIVAAVLDAVVVLPFLLMQDSSVQQRWKKLAAQLSLNYEPGMFSQGGYGLSIPRTQPQLIGAYRDRSVAIGITKASGVQRDKLSPLIDPPDRPAHKVDTLRIAVALPMPPETYLVFSRKLKLAGDALIAGAKQENIPQVERGDRLFDDKYRIYAHSETWVRDLLLVSSVRTQLMDWEPKRSELNGRPFGIEVCHGHVLYEEYRTYKTFATKGVVEALELVMAISAAVEVTVQPAE